MRKRFRPESGCGYRGATVMAAAFDPTQDFLKPDRRRTTTATAHDARGSRMNGRFKVMARRSAGLAMLFLVAACSPAVSSPSEESEFLQETIVPAIVNWSKGRDQTFPLFQIVAARSYDSICAVPEYTRTTSIESEVGDVTAYRGRRGDMVPEGHVAVIAVKDDISHVAYLYRGDLGLYGKLRRCRSAQRAILRRVPVAGTNIPSAVIEELR